MCSSMHWAFKEDFAFKSSFLNFECILIENRIFRIVYSYYDFLSTSSPISFQLPSPTQFHILSIQDTNSHLKIQLNIILKNQKLTKQTNKKKKPRESSRSIIIFRDRFIYTQKNSIPTKLGSIKYNQST